MHATTVGESAGSRNLLQISPWSPLSGAGIMLRVGINWLRRVGLPVGNGNNKMKESASSSALQLSANLV